MCVRFQDSSLIVLIVIFFLIFQKKVTGSCGLFFLKLILKMYHLRTSQSKIILLFRVFTYSEYCHIFFLFVPKKGRQFQESQELGYLSLCEGTQRFHLFPKRMVALFVCVFPYA